MALWKCIREKTGLVLPVCLLFCDRLIMACIQMHGHLLWVLMRKWDNKPSVRDTLYMPLQLILASSASQHSAACSASVVAMTYEFCACLLSLAIYAFLLPATPKLLHLLQLLDTDETLSSWAWDNGISISSQSGWLIQFGSVSQLTSYRENRTVLRKCTEKHHLSSSSLWSTSPRYSFSSLSGHLCWENSSFWSSGQHGAMCCILNCSPHFPTSCVLSFT